jgi:acetyl-CoA acetyltransferase
MGAMTEECNVGADRAVTSRLAEPSRELSRKVAIVGVGETDYGQDYRASRARRPDYVPPDAVSLADIAFNRAIADAGLRRQDIDGLSLCFMYASPEVNTVCDALGIRPQYVVADGAMIDDVIPPAVGALVSGRCNTMALVYAAPSRAIGRVYGGNTYGQEGATPKSYYYFNPWGWTSQAAHWAFVFRYYQNLFGSTEEDLASVAVTLRRHASRNENAIMREPLTIGDYMNSRYIVRPLHLFDLCLVNNGGVCLILRRTDFAGDLRHVPVEVAGWGHAKVSANKMQALVRERLGPQLHEAGRQAFAMAALSLADVDHFQGYDASSIHLINQIEGYGFVEPGTGLDFCKEGQMDLNGALPVNTSGGMLSEAYMHGWNHVVEAVRQVRHEAGPRQVADVQTSMFSLATTESAHPLLLSRGS